MWNFHWTNDIYLIFILGYSGYIPGVKAENVFGKTYSKTSEMSAKNEIVRGREEPPEIKYKSMFRGEYVQHDSNKHATVA